MKLFELFSHVYEAWQDDTMAKYSNLKKSTTKPGVRRIDPKTGKDMGPVTRKTAKLSVRPNSAPDNDTRGYKPLSDKEIEARELKAIFNKWKRAADYIDRTYDADLAKIALKKNLQGKDNFSAPDAVKADMRDESRLKVLISNNFEYQRLRLIHKEWVKAGMPMGEPIEVPFYGYTHMDFYRWLMDNKILSGYAALEKSNSLPELQGKEQTATDVFKLPIPKRFGTQYTRINHIYQKYHDNKFDEDTAMLMLMDIGLEEWEAKKVLDYQ